MIDVSKNASDRYQRRFVHITLSNAEWIAVHKWLRNVDLRLAAKLQSKKSVA